MYNPFNLDLDKAKQHTAVNISKQGFAALRSLVRNYRAASALMLAQHEISFEETK
jgi:hypothetical protein